MALARYPEFVEPGGLRPALLAEAQLLDVDLGEIAGGETQAQIRSDRGDISVALGAEERFFSVSISGKEHLWTAGSTMILTDVVRIAEAWRRGDSLAEISKAFPFMMYSKLAESLERGNATAVRWSELLEDIELELLRPLLTVVRSHDVLGRLFPSVSHYGVLHLWLNAENRDDGSLRISPISEGFEVWSSRGITRTAHSVDQAVRVSAEMLDNLVS